MNILQRSPFKRSYKKLYKNQLSEVNAAIKEIITNPTIGEEKKGDLAGVQVYKFNVLDQVYLLAYTIDETALILLALGVHENFYRDLKK